MASKKKPKGDYEVGYGKPPKQYQFKEGMTLPEKIINVGKPAGSAEGDEEP